MQVSERAYNTKLIPDANGRLTVLQMSAGPTGVWMPFDVMERLLEKLEPYVGKRIKESIEVVE